MSTHCLPPRAHTPGATLLNCTSRAQVAKQVEDGMGVRREEMEESWGSKLKKEAMIQWRGLNAFLAGTKITVTVLYARANLSEHCDVVSEKDWTGSIQRTLVNRLRGKISTKIGQWQLLPGSIFTCLSSPPGRGSGSSRLPGQLTTLTRLQGQL